MGKRTGKFYLLVFVLLAIALVIPVTIGVSFFFYKNNVKSVERTAAKVVSSISPDGRYRAETYGSNEKVTSGGINPSEGLRIVEIETDSVVWDMQPGYYDCLFLWSSDSQFLAISYIARIYEETIVVSIEDRSQIISVPIPEEVEINLREYRSDIYQKGTEWIDDTQLSISIQWIGKDDLTYTGRYIFNVITGEVTNLEIDEGFIPG